MWWPQGEGWQPWLYHPVGDGSPYDYVEVEVMREGWNEPALQEPEANHLGNAVGLFWRPAGPKRSPEMRLVTAIATLLRR